MWTQPGRVNSVPFLVSLEAYPELTPELRPRNTRNKINVEHLLFKHHKHMHKNLITTTLTLQNFPKQQIFHNVLVWHRSTTHVPAEEEEGATRLAGRRRVLLFTVVKMITRTNTPTFYISRCIAKFLWVRMEVTPSKERKKIISCIYLLCNPSRRFLRSSRLARLHEICIVFKDGGHWLEVTEVGSDSIILVIDTWRDGGRKWRF